MQQGWWPAAAFYTHPVMHISPLKILYHSTVIYETELWSFDEFRKYLPKADNCMVDGKMDFWYSYYLLDTIEGKLLRLFTKGNLDISSREPNYNQLLIFRNIKDKEDYDFYLKNHFSDYTDDEIYNEYKYQIQEDNDDNMGGLIYSAFQVAKCAKIYGDWIMSKQQVRKC